MKKDNPVSLFRPLEFELKYQLLLGVIAAIFSFILHIDGLSTELQIAILFIFFVTALLINGQMVKELKKTPTVRKGYFVFVQVRFWSVFTIGIVIMSIVVGANIFILKH